MNTLIRHHFMTECKRDSSSSPGEKLVVTHSAMAIAIALTICKTGTGLSTLLGIKGGTLPCVTAVVVSLATLFPSQLGKIAPSAEAVALILMQVQFFIIYFYRTGLILVHTGLHQHPVHQLT